MKKWKFNSWESFEAKHLPQYKDKIENFRKTLFEDLKRSGGLNIPIRTPKGEQFYDRKIK